MPFLVDSVAGAIASRGLIVHRLLHPVVCVERDEKGCLTSVGTLCDEAEKRESIMYLEIDHTDARGRQRLVGELHRGLDDVRAAGFDWKDRKSVVLGKSVSVRVNLGGRRIINKTKK